MFAREQYDKLWEKQDYEGIINALGIKKETVANHLGMSRQTFWKKLNDPSLFSIEEIFKMDVFFSGHLSAQMVKPKGEIIVQTLGDLIEKYGDKIESVVVLNLREDKSDESK